jgi:hypothetical protein
VFTFAPTTESGDKLTRFEPFSSQRLAGNVKILRVPWNEDLFRVLEGFPDLAHDDEVDACSGALEMLNPQMKGWGIYEATRRRAQELEEQRGRPQPTQTVYAPARWNGSPRRTNRTEPAASAPKLVRRRSWHDN